MNYPQEMVAGIVLFAGLVIYFVIRMPRYKDEKQRLLNKYRRVQNISLRVQDNLSKHLLSYDTENKGMLSDTDCQEYLKELQKDYARHLSKATYLKIRNSNNKRVLRKIDNLLNDTSLKLNRIADKVTEAEQKKSSDTSELFFVN